MSRPSEIQLTNVTVGDLQSNPRGGKTAPLLADGKPIRLKLRGCTTPFACSSYDKTSTRRALDVRTDADLRDFCARLDKAVLPFARKLTCQEGGYKSLAKPQKEGYEALFRQKITLDDDGKTPVKFFNEDKKRMSAAQIAAIEWRDDFSCPRCVPPARQTEGRTQLLQAPGVVPPRLVFPHHVDRLLEF